MKTAILIIFLRGWSGESVAIDSVEFDSIMACDIASNKLRGKVGANHKSNIKGAKYLTAVYVCVKKGGDK